jgi:hypothetical protein
MKIAERLAARGPRFAALAFVAYRREALAPKVGDSTRRAQSDPARWMTVEFAANTSTCAR